MQLSLTVDWWSPDTAAAVLGVTPDHVRALCRSAQLAAKVERGRWWIDPASVRRYLGRHVRERASRVREGAGNGE